MCDFAHWGAEGEGVVSHMMVKIGVEMGGARLPDAADAELVELGVGADDGNIQSESLGGDHAIKGVAMDGSQATGAKS